MPRKAGTGKGATGRFNIRLDDDTAAFFRTKANEHGLSASEYLRQTLVKGVIAENVAEIEERLKGLIDEIRAKAAPSQTSAGAAIPGHVILSIYTCEELLKAIVEARDPSQLYEAQDRAKARLKRDKGG